MNRFLDKFEFQPDTTCPNIAGTPSGFHLFHAPFSHFYAYDRFPFCDQWRNLFLEPLTIPGAQYTFSLGGVAIGSYEEFHDLVVANDHCWRAFLVDYIE